VARPGKVWWSEVRTGKAGQGKARLRKVRSGKVWRFSFPEREQRVWLCKVWSGSVRLVPGTETKRRGMVGNGSARKGQARLGKVRKQLGMAR